jgi:hypothetical protein
MPVEDNDPIFEKLKNNSAGWNPMFRWVNDLDDVANDINIPHEDYPLRVDKTKELIQMYVEAKPSLLTSFDIKSMHSYLFSGEDFNRKYIKVGGWRDTHVTVGNYTPPDPFHLDFLMNKITPVVFKSNTQSLTGKLFNATSESEMIDWYILFESIHPFQDGNGRVGGIALAVMSYTLRNGWYLVPLPYHYPM